MSMLSVRNLKKYFPIGRKFSLGRGGSDTTAVAIAASLKADLCEIYTDVDGVAVTIKIRFSFLLLAMLVVAFLWRILLPYILVLRGSAGLFYLLLIVSLVPVVAIIGWFGASLTFPVEKD